MRTTAPKRGDSLVTGGVILSSVFKGKWFKKGLEMVFKIRVNASAFRTFNHPYLHCRFAKALDFNRLKVKALRFENIKTFCNFVKFYIKTVYSAPPRNTDE